MTTAAVVNICSEPRLDQGAIRLQIRSRLERLGIRADFVYLTTGAGGNIEADLRETVDRKLDQGEEIVFAAVLHHDGCLAEQQGQRRPLLMSANELTIYLAQHRVRCPIHTGSIRMETNNIAWADESDPSAASVSVGAQAQAPNPRGEEPSVAGPIVALVAGVLAVIAVVVVFLALRPGEGEEGQATIQSTPLATATSSIPSATRTRDGHFLVLDPKADCTGESDACSTTVIDLSSIEVWMEGNSLFILVTASEGGFLKLDSYILRFAFDTDRNSATRINNRFEANGLGQDFEIRLIKNGPGMPGPQADISPGVAPPGPRRRIVEENTVLLELGPFPTNLFHMLVRVEVGGVQDVIPDGAKLAMPEGYLLPK